MSKKLLIILFVSIFCGIIFSQNIRQLNDIEKQIIEQKIVAQSTKIETLQCDFSQEKTSTLISEKAEARGVLLYQTPSKLRWEYNTPTPSTLILNGNNALLLDKNGQKTGDERMVKQLGAIIISMINGSGITQNKQFSAEYFEIDNSLLLIVLTPVQKRLKDFYNTIEVKIDINTMLANNIILNEKTGDKMIISLKNIVLNSEISQNKFNVQ